MKDEKEYGLVLAGGGTRGAYQVGAWKALQELNIKIKGIAGASIGALNGALFLQNDYAMISKMYETIKINNVMKISGVDGNKNIFDLSNIFNLASNYRKQNGIDNTPLRKMIEKYIDMDKLYNSPIDFGLVTYSVKSRQPLQKFKNEIAKKEMVNYLLASSCFPIFKPQIINNEEYYDGGLYDSAPTNMLIDKGYKNIILVDIAGVGLSRKLSTNKGIYLKIIRPSEDLGGTFDFNHTRIVNNIKLGYLDTMRAFNKLQGHIYYFKNEEFQKMLEVFNLETIYGLEYAAQIYNMYKYREYTFEEFINELYKRHRDAERRYNKIKNNNYMLKIGKQLKILFEKGLGICIVNDLYMDRPASKLSNYLLNFVKDYRLAAKSLIELKNYIN